MNYLQRWDAARQAIIEAHSVDELKQIRDQAEAYRYALRLAGESRDVVRKAEEIKLRAERRAGELLKDAPKHEGGNPNLSKDTTGCPATLEQLGVTRDESSRWQKIASIPEDKFEQFIATAPEITTSGAVRLAKEVEREERHAALVPFLVGESGRRYSIIYCDPPWSYTDKAANTGRWAGAVNHYPCMSINELCDLEVDDRPVSDIASPDALLFMWVTAPLLPDTFKVIEAWGFFYKTIAFTWVKRNADGSPYIGLGNYTRQNAELCLLARRGRGVERKSASVSSVVDARRTEHSSKPRIVRDLIVELCGDVPRIELFAREKVDGWDVWGNEAKQEALAFSQ